MSAHARPTRRGALLLVLVGLLLVLAGCASSGNSGSTSKPNATKRPAATAGHAVGARFSTSPPSDWRGDTIAMGDLPTQAIVTLELVESGGPYPYSQDDGVFGNRARVLPARPSGTYREYTVVTPGSPDRGARRLVIADGRDVYYTDDHYDTFRFVTP